MFCVHTAVQLWERTFYFFLYEVLMCALCAVVCPVQISIYYHKHLKRLRGEINCSHCDNDIYLDIFDFILWV